MEERNFDVYKATNKLNNKYYIGVTTQGVGARMKNHLYKALSGSQYKFHKALAEVGLENFTVEVIDSTTDVEEAKNLEKYWIEKLHANNSDYGYNSDCGGDIMFHTEETKAKISAIHKGKDMSSAYKSLLQYSLQGKFICEYDSCTEAEKKTGISRASILRVIKKSIKTTSKKNPYIWVFKSELPNVPLQIDPTPWKPTPRVRDLSENFIKARESQKKMGGKCGVMTEVKAVIQLDKEGNEIARFNSINDAVRNTGVSTTTIVNHCNGVYLNKYSDANYMKRVKFLWRWNNKTEEDLNLLKDRLASTLVNNFHK